MNNRILMRIDFQNDFVHPNGKLSVAAPDLIERHQKFAANLQRGMFDAVIDSYDTHFLETYLNTNEAKSYPPHCIFGTKGWQSAAPFKDNIELIKIFKGTTNIWHEKHNCAILSTEWQNKKVYLCGVLSDVCVKEAMDGLLKRGAEVCILEDLCLGLNRQIGDILNDEVYRPFINAGKLHSITSTQFFRTCLLEKKTQHNLVHFSERNDQ